jgi:hypothetical protein
MMRANFRLTAWDFLHQTTSEGRFILACTHAADIDSECAASGLALIQEHINLLGELQIPLFETDRYHLQVGKAGSRMVFESAGKWSLHSSSDTLSVLVCREAAIGLLLALCMLPRSALATVVMQPELYKKFKEVVHRALKAKQHESDRGLLKEIEQYGGRTVKDVMATLESNISKTARVPRAAANEDASGSSDEHAPASGKREFTVDEIDSLVRELDAQAAGADPNHRAERFGREAYLTSYLNGFLPPNQNISIDVAREGPFTARALARDPHLTQVVLELIEDLINGTPSTGALRHQKCALVMLLLPPNTWDAVYWPLPVVQSIAHCFATRPWKGEPVDEYLRLMAAVGHDAEAMVAKLVENAQLRERYHETPMARAPEFQDAGDEIMIPLWQEMCRNLESQVQEADAEDAHAQAGGGNVAEAAAAAEPAEPTEAAEAAEAAEPRGGQPVSPAQAEEDEPLKRPEAPTNKGLKSRSDTRILVQERNWFELGAQGAVAPVAPWPTSHHRGELDKSRPRLRRQAIAADNKIWMRAKAGCAKALELWRFKKYGPTGPSSGSAGPSRKQS